jgi:circadian clock protein KaiB
MKNSDNSGQDCEKGKMYIFRLYVVGNEPNSRIARENLENICNEFLKGRCQVEIVDVLKDFQAALADKVFVTPALVLVEPQPRAVVLGSLRDKDKVISALRLKV